MPLPAHYAIRHDAARAAADAVEAAGAALRDAHAGHDARACLRRLEAWRPAAEARWKEFDPTSLNHSVAALGGDVRGTVAHAYAVVGRLRAIYHPIPPPEGRPPTATVTTLAEIPRRIAALTAYDQHACAKGPPACGCVLGTLQADLESAERAAETVPRALDTLDELRAQMDRAMDHPRGGAVTRLSARPTAPGVTFVPPLEGLTPDIPKKEPSHGR